MADTIDLLVQAAVAYEEAWNRYASVRGQVGETWIKGTLAKSDAHQHLLDVIREYKKETGDQDDREQREHGEVDQRPGDV